MKLNNFDENIHSLIILAITLMAIFSFFINSHPSLNIPLSLALFIIYQRNNVGLKSLLKIIIGGLFFSLFCSYFILFVPAADFQNGNQIHFLGLTVSEALLKKQTHIFLKLATLSIISLSSIMAINFEKIMIYFMSNKIINVNLGYPLLLAFNSISLIKSEFEKIRINARFRRLSIAKQINIFFPLLVYSIRHADRGALSLITRGLNENKTFYFSTELRLKDKILFFVFLIIIIILWK